MQVGGRQGVSVGTALSHPVAAGGRRGSGVRGHGGPTASPGVHSQRQHAQAVIPPSDLPDLPAAPPPTLPSRPRSGSLAGSGTCHGATCPCPLEIRLARLPVCPHVPSDRLPSCRRVRDCLQRSAARRSALASSARLLCRAPCHYASRPASPSRGLRPEEDAVRDLRQSAPTHRSYRQPSLISVRGLRAKSAEGRARGEWGRAQRETVGLGGETSSGFGLPPTMVHNVLVARLSRDSLRRTTLLLTPWPP